MKRPCLDCRQLFVVERSKQSRCDGCAGAHRRHARPRDTAEPWRFIYKAPRFVRARARVITRDERCRAVVEGRRCGVRHGLQVHHDPPLEQLWATAAADFDLFVELATDERKLYALCPKHHAFADSFRRRANPSDG